MPRPSGRSAARARAAAIALAASLVLLTSLSASAGASTPGSSAEAAVGPADCSAPAGVLCTFGVPYGDGPNQTLDVYFSLVSRGEPVVMMIHGGGWMAGSSTDMYNEAVYYAENGFTVFSLNYTLSTPDTPDWPQVFTDVETATAWVRAHASDYGADGSRIAAVGSSAGAHLAALLDVAGPEDGLPLVAAVSWSGPMDMALAYRDGDDYVHTAIEELLGCVPGSCPNDEDVTASPTSHVTSDDGALLMFNSRVELVPISGTRLMNRELKAAQVAHQLVVFKATHGHASEYECQYALVLHRWAPVIDDTMRWVGKYLTGVPTNPTGTYCR